MRRITRAIVAITILSACAGEPKEKQPEMTQRQRDSAIAESGLPGAGGVRRALQVADSAEARQRAAESIDP
jgi:hypothetical protein